MSAARANAYAKRFRATMLEPAGAAIRRLRDEASAADWIGKSALAQSLRDQAARLEASGELYLPKF